MMYYVNCSCVPPENGGPTCHVTNCELRQIPITCVDPIQSNVSDPSRQQQQQQQQRQQQQQQLMTMVGHSGSLVPLPVTAPGLSASDSMSQRPRIVFQASAISGEELPRKPMEGSVDSLELAGDFFEQPASTEVTIPGYTKPIAEWSASHVKVLLDVYERDRPKFLRKGLIAKKLWKEVAQKVNKETGLQLKGTHCENKWKVLMRGYRRAEKEFSKSDVNGEEFRRTFPFFKKLRNILAQKPTDEVVVSARDVETLSRESRMVWRPDDTRRLLRHYRNFRKRLKSPNLTQASWEEMAKQIHQEDSSFVMNGSQCYSRFRFLRIKYQRAMMLCANDAARWSQCPMFNELRAILWEDPLPAEVPLTPSQISKRRKECRSKEAKNACDREHDEVDCTSVIELESHRQPQEEFSAYLAKLLDGLTLSLKERAMQGILSYVFNFRKKVRLAKNSVSPDAVSS